MALDREDLKSWYRGAMQGRLVELRGFRAALRSTESGAHDATRSVAQALRGSGATFGYPELSVAAGHVESAPDSELLRRMEGLIEHLHRLATQDEGAGTLVVEWLVIAAGGAEDGSDRFADLDSAWRSVSDAQGLSQDRLAQEVADLFGLRTADLTKPSKAALRLVPQALMQSAGVLPLSEDSETITVATSDPTSIDLEMELARLTGRTPRFVVAPPHVLRQTIAVILDGVAPASTGSSRAERRDDGAASNRVLVVDDEPAARMFARALLEKGEYEVEEAGDGEEALEVLGAGKPVALVLADLNMPRLDGLELIWEMRATDRWSRIPVIVVTGETDEILETKLIEEGADDYIRKPLDPRLFLARVTATIRRAEH
ncbi:MAG: response regulator [Gemmatimonadota bacterium]|nr:response regulator [Gemmatimonadota bacterium]